MFRIPAVLHAIQLGKTVRILEREHRHVPKRAQISAKVFQAVRILDDRTYDGNRLSAELADSANDFGDPAVAGFKTRARSHVAWKTRLGLNPLQILHPMRF